MEPMIVENLAKQFGSVAALAGVSFRVEPGEVLAILGPSGCGKSTLLSLVAGLEEPSTGQIRLGERLLSRPGYVLGPEKRGLNMVFQDYALWPHLRVRDIVGYGLRHTGVARHSIAKRVGDLLDLLRISHLAHRYPAQLSGGQQQRVAIARALATEPAVLLLDEPLSNLDVQLRQEMREELAGLFERLQMTALYVTHDPLEASSLAHRIVVLREGKIEQLDTPERLFAEPRSMWVARLAGYETQMDAETIAEVGNGVWEVRMGGQALRARLHGDISKDQSVRLFLHPDTPRLISPESPLLSATENGLSGVVLRSLFEGRVFRVSVQVAEGARFLLRSPVRLTTGAAVSVAIPVADTLGFAD
jgi:ABC-type Fe3+/spermidine/putrescine transport system ATPase subunit